MTFEIGDRIIPIGGISISVQGIIDHWNRYWTKPGWSCLTEQPAYTDGFYVIGVYGLEVCYSTKSDGKGPRIPYNYMKLVRPKQTGFAAFIQEKGL